MALSVSNSLFNPLKAKRLVSGSTSYKSASKVNVKASSVNQRSLLNRQQIRTVYSINKITLLGHAGGSPQGFTFADGTSVVNFNLAVSESFTKKTGERVDRTDWFRVAVYNDKLSEMIHKSLQKGSRVYVEGQLKPRKWVDATGVEKTTLEVIVRGKGEVIVLNKNASSEQQEQQHQISEHHQQQESIPEASSSSTHDHGYSTHNSDSPL